MDGFNIIMYPQITNMTQPPCLLEQLYYSRRQQNTKRPNYPFIHRQLTPLNFLTGTQPYDCMFRILTVLPETILRILAYYTPKGCSFVEPEVLPQVLHSQMTCSKCPLYKMGCEPIIDMTEQVQNILLIEVWRNLKRNPTLM